MERVFQTSHCFEYTPTVASSPTDLMVTQRGPTTVIVSWSPPSPVGGTTGYTIFYSTGDSPSSKEVTDTATSEERLMDLKVGGNYSIYLVAVSQHLPSKSLTASLQLVLGKTHSSIAAPVSLEYSLSQFPQTWSSLWER